MSKIRGGKFIVNFTPSPEDMIDPEVQNYRFRFFATAAEISLPDGTGVPSLYNAPFVEKPKAPSVSVRVPYDLPPEVVLPAPVNEQIFVAVTAVDDVMNESDPLGAAIPFDVEAPKISGTISIQPLN